MPKYTLPAISEAGDLKGKYVLVRSSFNVPIENGEIRNHFRVIRSLPTLEYLVREGARVIVCSHLGREKENTLEPIYEYLKQSLKTTVVFSPEVVGSVSKNLRDQLEDGHVLVLENVRRDPRETQNDADFARNLADLADVFVNDAFESSHRDHASLSAVTQFLPSYFGSNFINEYTELSKAELPEHPSLFILGGAKFETKMPLVEKFLELYDHVIISGALANDFYKARGFEVGRSLVSDMDLSNNPMVNHPKIILPSDVIVTNEKGEARTTIVEDVQPNEAIMDAGPNTIDTIELFSRNAKTILWNGPLGNYEAGFSDQTLACAKMLAESPAYTLVGGGDTTAAIESLSNYDKYTFVSTAGGAMLTFLELGTLPAIEVVMNKK